MGISPRIFKNYCNNRFIVSDYNLNIISTNWIKLENLIDKTNKYKKNKKPCGNPILKRSIFN